MNAGMKVQRKGKIIPIALDASTMGMETGKWYKGPRMK